MFPKQKCIETIIDARDKAQQVNMRLSASHIDAKTFLEQCVDDVSQIIKERSLVRLIESDSLPDWFRVLWGMVASELTNHGCVIDDGTAWQAFEVSTQIYEVAFDSYGDL